MTTSADALHRLVTTAARLTPGDALGLVDEVGRILGAASARLYIADYGLRRLQEVDTDGPVGPALTMAGTLPGRAFATGEVLVSETSPTVVSVPLADGVERIGLLELRYDEWPGELPDLLDAVVAVLVMALVTKRRYTDQWARARRSVPLTPAAEIQWDLLPPLSCSTAEVAVGGILEPAYEIGGDSFDYAVNGPLLELAIVDAIGRGLSAVLMSAAAVNSLRNSRRAGVDLKTTYEVADRVIESQFGSSFFVTAQMAQLDIRTGMLTWVNAGHMPPLLIRNGTFAGELRCTPSLPIGLGGKVAEVATTALQTGDRVLFYTDGLTESVSPDGTRFGEERLADYLVRSSLDRVPVAETARRLAAHVMDHVTQGLSDDATILLVEYRGPDRTAGTAGLPSTR